MAKAATLLLCVAGAVFADAQSFPTEPDPSAVIMRVEGASCLGTCADYLLEIHGDGRVDYQGEGHILVEGKFSWTIPQAQVTELVDEFRRLDFLSLRDNYHDGSIDSARYRAHLTVGDRAKTVTYGDGLCEADSSPDDCIEERLTAMQAAINRISGADSFIHGDAQTSAKLERAKFDFRSPRAANALMFALDNRDTALARQFLARGTSPNIGSLETWEGEQSAPAILIVPATADVELAKAMIEMGGLPDKKTRKEFLAASLLSGVPEMAKLALEHHPQVRKKDPDFPWIVLAASAGMETDGTYYREEYAKPEYALWVAKVDPPAVIRLMLAAGADPNSATVDGDTALHRVRSEAAAQLLIDAGVERNARNSEGRTPLHQARNAGIVRVLVEAGADVDARDLEGKTPLFDCYDAEVTRALLRAGANPNAHDENGETALFNLGDSDVAKALIEAGTDLNARTNDGSSALASAKSVDVALEMLRAGATLPEQSEQLARLVEWARLNKADDLIREIQQRIDRR